MVSSIRRKSEVCRGGQRVGGGCRPCTRADSGRRIGDRKVESTLVREAMGNVEGKESRYGDKRQQRVPCWQQQHVPAT
eukprot:6212302-Pleurochrysis_carterae.AAC.4